MKIERFPPTSIPVVVPERMVFHPLYEILASISCFQNEFGFNCPTFPSKCVLIIFVFIGSLIFWPNVQIRSGT